MRPNLNQSLMLRDTGGSISLQDWAGFYIWAGWWLRHSANDRCRLIMFAVAPSRRFAAAFAALGALIGGNEAHSDNVDWESLTAIPVGTKVFWRERSLKAKSGFKRLDGTLVDVRDGSVAILHEDKKNGNTTLTWNEKKLVECPLSLGAITARLNEQYAVAAKLLKDASVDVNQNWLWTSRREAILITEQTSFRRDADSIALVSKQGSEARLSEALFLSEREGRGKVVMSSPRSVGAAPTYPLVIFDGANAFLSREAVNSSSTLAIMDRSEYDEEMHNRVLAVASARIPLEVAKAEQPPETPPGLEAALFSLPGDR